MSHSCVENHSDVARAFQARVRTRSLETRSESRARGETSAAEVGVCVRLLVKDVAGRGKHVGKA
jgi:hypothetical protein